tara:strand:+ start:451 stop:651 length:201 start_codon:yes stop_codon:yes gene_type:complete
MVWGFTPPTILFMEKKMQVLSEVLNSQVKDAVNSVKKVLTNKKPEMLEEQIRDKVPTEKENKNEKI